ncbi:hypothetical protein PULV_a1479 [Pseudoalteromonas ulvae UL12]|nr:hypothetical protein [Pseudoalteromonas ulvae UL12]
MIAAFFIPIVHRIAADKKFNTPYILFTADRFLFFGINTA